MASMKKIRAALHDAIGSEKLVRLDRASRPSQVIDGFVVAVGRGWALLQRTMDGGFFDGHLAIRLDEIRGVREDSSFESTFARSRPEWPPAPPVPDTELDLDSTTRMLTSLLRAGELFGIERNRKYDAKWIGVPNELTRHWLYMWEVRPDASWHEKPLGYRIRTITMVTINDHYQRALAVVAGQPPADPSDPAWG
ncbi:hypothetical protein [Microbacterium sp. LWH7-1.2]|uniref:hypothetical protein n=1 Tax=Microbacterium sp. LWH7-1.2 TaxID=3135257 RepID=UPI0031396FDC